MKITYYLYNAFIIEWEENKIAIDPGALFAYWFSFAPLIPIEEWHDITHVLVTHGDPDHHWHTDRVLKASGAKLIVNETMVRAEKREYLMLGPRSKGLKFDTDVINFHTLSVDQCIEVGYMKIRGIYTSHGPLKIKIGPFRKVERPGPKERIGWGNIGFEIRKNGKSIVNLGDSLLHAREWSKIQSPDVLMIPIGGAEAGNTMDEKEALEAVKIIEPKLVIPMHYDCPMFFHKKGNPANAIKFQKRVQALGVRCEIMQKGQTIQYLT